MLRKIINIDEEKCNGCGLCAEACHEGAIKIINNKAKLMHDNYCDGLGDCLPVCPEGAITFIVREAQAYNEKAVLENKKSNAEEKSLPCGCPGTNSKLFIRDDTDEPHIHHSNSWLKQWPVQIKLVPANAPYFDNSNLLICADCTAYAYADFHNKFIKNHITLIGCPKLDDTDYAEKLTAVIESNNINSITIVRMEVPCCSGIEKAAKDALNRSGKLIPCKFITISTDGKIID